MSRFDEVVIITPISKWAKDRCAAYGFKFHQLRTAGNMFKGSPAICVTTFITKDRKEGWTAWFTEEDASWVIDNGED